VKFGFMKNHAIYKITATKLDLSKAGSYEVSMLFGFGDVCFPGRFLTKTLIRSLTFVQCIQ
jgi:hypothetical protein